MMSRETERRNPAARDIDSRPINEIVRTLYDEDRLAYNAIEPVLPRIAHASETAASCIRSGGTVYYAGAGTSGRLGVLDAVEIPPTFGCNRFEAVIAGGAEAVTRAVEGAEDDREQGSRSASGATGTDFVIGITASGRTPFVLGFLDTARSKGADCVLITCANHGETSPPYEVIHLQTGPEVVAGSTRLKAATATKITLNLISTGAMILLGGVHDGLMVDVVPSNEKLRRRAVSIVQEITGCNADEAEEALGRSGMSPKLAALMVAGGIGRDRAERLVRDGGGSLRKALRLLDEAG